MIKKWVATAGAFFIIITLNGCGTVRIVSVAELVWNPSTFSKDECPDLRGTYQNVTSSPLLSLYSGVPSSMLTQTPNGQLNLPWYADKKLQSMRELKFPEKHVVLNNKKDLDAYLLGLKFSILYSQEVIIQEIHNSSESKIITPLNTVLAGCSNGSLVLRNLFQTSGGDFAPIVILYGESETRKLSDGSLKITQRSRRQVLSATTGALSAVKELPTVTRVYPLVDDLGK